ncbi:unnamed protein product [Moneuplotes crassus]|uniref:Uncharacterized protein n=1 Tax=Euplotes crassus TaxID=5936 RepID=A0AAD1XF84_EUPCR|nr:unnamed protein product [Moneuplotes crassus]
MNTEFLQIDCRRYKTKDKNESEIESMKRIKDKKIKPKRTLFGSCIPSSRQSSFFLNTPNTRPGYSNKADLIAFINHLGFYNMPKNEIDNIPNECNLNGTQSTLSFSGGESSQVWNLKSPTIQKNKDISRQRYKFSSSLVSNKLPRRSSFSRNKNQNLSISGTKCLKSGIFSTRKKQFVRKKKQLKVNFKTNLNIDLFPNLCDTEKETSSENSEKIVDVKIKNSCATSTEGNLQSIPVIKAKVSKKKPLRIKKSIHMRTNFKKPNYILFSPLCGYTKIEPQYVSRKQRFEPFKNLKFMSIRRSFDEAIHTKTIIHR